MTWNCCPWCSHRVYQHNDKGCLHVDHIPLDDGTTHDKPCDCTKPHPLLVEA
jgi:hypothetical protein